MRWLDLSILTRISARAGLGHDSSEVKAASPATAARRSMASSYPRSMIIARASGIRRTTTTKANAQLPSCGLDADKPQEFDQSHEAIRRLRALDHRPLHPYGRPLRGLAQAHRRHRHRRRALGAVLALVPLVLREGAGGATCSRGDRVCRARGRPRRPPTRSTTLSR